MFSFNQFCDVGAADTIKMSLEDAFDFVKSGKSLYELIPDPCRIYFDLDLYADEAIVSAQSSNVVDSIGIVSPFS